MQTKQRAWKKTLSVVLTVVMALGYLGLFSGVLNPVASAATAGNYRVYVGTRVSNGTRNDAWGEAWVRIYYKTDNGTGGETYFQHDLTREEGNGSDELSRDISLDVTIPGYPTEVKIMADMDGYGTFGLGHDALTFRVESVKVWDNNTNDWSVIWQGDICVDSEVNEYTAWCNAGGCDSSSTKDANGASESYNNWASSMPNAAAVEVTGDDSIDVPTTGTNTATYSAVVKDQYGVTWNADHTGWDFTTATGISGTGSAGGDATVSVTTNANTQADPYYYRVVANYGTVSGYKDVQIVPHGYTITYKSYDGSDTYKTATVGMNGSDTYAPTWTGWSFLGWASSPNSTTADIGYTVGSVTENKTVYAVWSKSLDATFKYMDGDATMEATVYNGNTSATVSAPGADKVPATATKDGLTYTLTGWATTNAATSDISSGYTTGNTYYAVYSVNGTLKYDANNGANAPDDGSAALASNYNGTAFNGSFTVGNNEPSRAGYTFLGWSAASNATSAEISKGGTVATDALTKTIYAVWSANTDTAYTVKYYLQNSDGSDYELKETRGCSGTTDTPVVLNVYKETKTGFTFEKFTLGDSTVAVTDVSANLAGDGSLTINVYYTRNQYDVTVPTGTGYTVNTTGGSVYYQNPFSFELTLDAGYTQTPPTVTANGVTLTGTLKAGTENTYVYTVASVEEATTVLINGLALNTYTVTLPSTDTGAWTAASAASSVTHGNDYSFTVTVDRAYTQTVPAVTYKEGDGAAETIDASSVTDNADGSKTYTYVRNSVTANGVVAVGPMEKNTYSVALPSGTGYTTVAAEGVDLNAVVDGTNLQFSVVLDQQYNRSAYRVLRNGVLLTPNDGGVYTVNVTGDIPLGEIEVKDVTLNHYYIALALDTEMGYTIEVPAGYNPRATLSGTEFKFQLFLDPAYDQSAPVVKLSKDGGATYNVMTVGADGFYTIASVLSDCIVVVENVAINKYTVIFNDAAGSPLETHNDVPYGSSVSFGGTAPTKAEEILDSSTVSTTEGGVTTTVTTETVRAFTFRGWSADTAKVTADITADPIFSAQEFTRTTTTVGEDDPTIEEGEKTDATVTVLFLDYNAATLYKATVIKGQNFAGYAGAAPERASSNPHASYTFVGWDKDGDSVADIHAGDSTAMTALTEDVTLVAVYEYSLGTRPVQFYTYNGSLLLYSANVNLGEKAVYGTSSIPSRRDDIYEYTFAGWSYSMNSDETGVLEDLTVPAAAAGDPETIKLYAAYSKTPIQYSCQFVNDGVVLQQDTFTLVDGVNEYYYNGSTPERAGTASTDYAFAGWTVTQTSHNVLFTARYTESTHVYDSVSLTAGDGLTIAGDPTAPYGSTYTFTVTSDATTSGQEPVVTDALGNTLTPTGRTGDDVNGYTYTYEIQVVGDTVEEVEKKLTITATTTVNKYVIVFKNDNGTTLKTYTLDYGVMPNYDGEPPTKAATDQYTYTFNGWNPSVAPATKNQTYVATYDTTVNSYTVKFLNYDGSLLDEQVLAYGATPVYGGATPVKNDDPTKVYIFDGWNDPLVPVVGNTTYTAVFTEAAASYTITFVNYDGSVLKTMTVGYGVTPDYGEPLPVRENTLTETFTFEGWTPELKPATEDATYTAVFSKTEKELTFWEKLINFFKTLMTILKGIFKGCDCG